MAGPAGGASSRRVVQQVESHQMTLEKPDGEGQDGVSWKTDKCLARAGHGSAGGWGALVETQAREARERSQEEPGGQWRTLGGQLEQEPKAGPMGNWGARQRAME